MEIDLRDKKGEVPIGIRDGVTGIHEESEDALERYFSVFAIPPKDIDVIRLGEGRGGGDDKCRWAAAIATRFNARVHFTHNTIPVTVYPSNYEAALADWTRNQEA
jgi:hypothetical protein